MPRKFEQNQTFHFYDGAECPILLNSNSIRAAQFFFHVIQNLFRATLIYFQYTLNSFNIWSVTYARLLFSVDTLFFYFFHSFVSLTLDFKNNYYTSQILTQSQENKVLTLLSDRLSDSGSAVGKFVVLI